MAAFPYPSPQPLADSPLLNLQLSLGYWQLLPLKTFCVPPAPVSSNLACPFIKVSSMTPLRVPLPSVPQHSTCNLPYSRPTSTILFLPHYCLPSSSSKALRLSAWHPPPSTVHTVASLGACVHVQYVYKLGLIKKETSYIQSLKISPSWRNWQSLTSFWRT